MEERAILRQRIVTGRAVAIVRLHDAAPLVDVAQALVAGGIRAFEFTLTTPGALAAIERCRGVFDADVVVGAGTVLDTEDARRAIDAGAQFLVSPGVDMSVIGAARESGVLSIPGAMTPTEIVAAWRAGADVVKLFPARALGPRYLSDVLGPLPDVRLMPTGGIDATNAPDYLRAGAAAVAVGGALVDFMSIARADWASLTKRARALVAAVCI